METVIKQLTFCNPRTGIVVIGVVNIKRFPLLELACIKTVITERVFGRVELLHIITLLCCQLDSYRCTDHMRTHLLEVPSYLTLRPILFLYFVKNLVVGMVLPIYPICMIPNTIVIFRNVVGDNWLPSLGPAIYSTSAHRGPCL